MQSYTLLMAAVVCSVNYCLSPGLQPSGDLEWMEVEGTSIPVPPPEHPRLYLRQKHVSDLKKRMTHPVLKPIWDDLVRSGERGGSRLMELNALRYLSDRDDRLGREIIIETLKLMQDFTWPNKQDIVISDWYKKRFENPGAGDDAWALHIIGSPRAHDIEISDFDGDTDLDIVTRQQGGAGNRIEIWTQNGLDSWTHHSIDCPGGEGLHLGDIDKDGDADIIIGGRWYENTIGLSNGAWIEHIFTHEYDHAATFPLMVDMDQDGCPDVVLAPTESRGGSYRISWFEAPDDPESGGWSEHIIDSPVETVVHSLGVADMDSDGDLDVVTAEMHQGNDPDEVRVHINEDGAGMTWTKQVIATTGSHNIRVIDIGSDGDYDVFGAN